MCNVLPVMLAFAIHCPCFNEFSLYIPEFFRSQPHHRLDDNTTGIDQQRIPIVEAYDFIQVNLEGANAASGGQGGSCQDPRISKAQKGMWLWRTVGKCVRVRFFPESPLFCNIHQRQSNTLEMWQEFCGHFKGCSVTKVFQVVPRKLSICLCVFLML